VFDLVHRREVGKPNEIWQAHHTLLDLQCTCPRKIRASATVLAAGPITCSVCGYDFAAQDGDQ
jgi:hypothetical protein